MRNDHSNVIEEYLDKKYEKYCIEVLYSSTDTNQNENLTLLNFYSNFDELVFGVLYDYKNYKNLLKKTYFLIYDKLNQLERYEIDFLLTKCKSVNYQMIGCSDSHQFIAEEMIKIINKKVALHVSNNTYNLDLFLEDLKNEIEDFAYDGPIAGGDYEISSYWEEFCFQIQYGEEYWLEIILGDIENHLCNKLNQVSLMDIIILYTATDHFYYEEAYLTCDFPFPSKDEMIENIIIKMIVEIKTLASNTYIPDFPSGEVWED